MALNLFGLAAGATAFLSIWFGHVAVRKIEARAAALWQPILAAALLGLALELAALVLPARLPAMVCGILGVSLLWDALEFKRQARRVAEGRAPANPQNPRHAALLAIPGGRATTLDLLARPPLGRPVDPQEAIRLAAASGSPEGE
jgi:hypothetical protein